MNDIELQEYFAVEKAVSDFDLRLLTIKGWGVTLSLAAPQPAECGLVDAGRHC